MYLISIRTTCKNKIIRNRSVFGEYKIYAYACDTLNHCSGKYSNSFYIDVTKPTVSISSSNNVDSKQSVKLEFSDEHSGIYSYSWKAVDLGAVEMIYSGETAANVEVSAPGEVSLTATDAAGNTNSTSVTFYKTILRVPGSSDDNIITLSGNSFTLPNVSPASGYNFVGWNTNENGTGVSYSAGSSYTVTSTTTLYAILEKVIVDSAPPSITFSPNGTTDWVKNATTQIYANDKSGVSVLKIYPIDNENFNFNGATSGNIISSGDSYTFSRKTGIYYIYAYACDNLGNCTTERSDAFYLDNSYPSLTITNPYNGSNWYNKASLDAEKEYTLTIDASDVGSGIDYYQYKYSGTNNSFVTISGCSGTTCETPEFTNEANGETVYVKVCDNAGLCTSSSTSIYIDVTPPTVACNASGAWASQTFSQGFDCTLETLKNNGYFNGSRPSVGETIYHSISGSGCSVSYTKMNCDASGSYGKCDSVFNVSDNFGIGSKTCGNVQASDSGDTTSSGRWRATECNCIYDYCTATLTYKVYDIAGNYAENTFVYSHMYDDANEFPSVYPQYCP